MTFGERLYQIRKEANLSQEEQPKKYTSEKMWVVWNTFTSNLSGVQRGMFMLLYVLTVIFMAVVVIMFVHGLGYEFGKFLAKIIFD